MVSAAIAAVAVVGGVVSANKQSKATKSAAQTQADAAREAAGINVEQFNIAREAIERNNAIARKANILGTAAALDVNAQIPGAQIGAFQQGTFGAQQSLISGLAQQQNALLGRPVDLSGFKAQNIDFDPSQFSAEIPEGLTAIANQDILVGDEIKSRIRQERGQAELKLLERQRQTALANQPVKGGQFRPNANLGTNPRFGAGDFLGGRR